MSSVGLSIVIPLYNARDWIAPTIDHIIGSLEGANFDAEIIVIDDGSTDNGAQAARSANVPVTVPLTVVSQKNAGRYLARKHGVELSAKENVLFVDSRVFVDNGSLRFLSAQLVGSSDQIWNGHVTIDKKGNLFARFWDAIVCIAWRRYFRKPATTSYGQKDFDYYPKGTGFFYVPKARLLDAMAYFEKNTNDLRYSSDDTLLIRSLIKYQDIHLSPEFSCLYHGRSNMKGFLKHAYGRGQFFIDGFLRPGTRFFVPLLAVLILSVLIPVAAIVWPGTVLVVVGGLLLLFILGLFFGAVVLGVNAADAGALAVLGVPFGAVYLVGLWRGVVRKYAHKDRERVTT